MAYPVDVFCAVVTCMGTAEAICGHDYPTCGDHGSKHSCALCAEGTEVEMYDRNMSGSENIIMERSDPETKRRRMRMKDPCGHEFTEEQTSYDRMLPKHYENLPADLIEAVRDHVVYRRPKGDFITAVLANDLKRAVGRADGRNIEHLPALVKYLYNFAPINCWGSHDAVDEWLEDK